jgi:hypothetical protein
MKHGIVFIIFFLLTTALSAAKARGEMDLIITTMNHCYEKQNKTGIDLAKCMLAKFGKKDNPDGYKINITDDNPGKLTASIFKIEISNKYGHLFKCIGIAAEKIKLKQCTAQKVQPLTNSNKMER